MAQRPLRILCFGDSLTTGYTQDGSCYRPYSKALADRLRAAFPGLDIDIAEDGLDGGVTTHFQSRLAAAYRTADKPYDWVVVLGGTNDLPSNAVQPEAIFENLERTWSLAKHKKSKVLALTVPEAAYLGRSKFASDINAKRDQLNALIMGYTAPNFHVFDLKSAFSYTTMPVEDRRRYWDDRVHFTATGYDMMGAKIGDAFVEILKVEDDGAAGKQSTTLSSVRPRKKRRMFKDDDNSFEEEGGAPDDLRHGYIVVRRKDLD